MSFEAQEQDGVVGLVVRVPEGLQREGGVPEGELGASDPERLVLLEALLEACEHPPHGFHVAETPVRHGQPLQHSGHQNQHVIDEDAFFRNHEPFT